jgi:hypothetical protein
MKEGGSPSGLVFAAGVCSESVGLEELEVRRYAISLLYEFFKQRGRDLKVPDYRRMLTRIFNHIHNYIAEKWSEQGLELDLAVAIATTTTVYAARSGRGELFLFHEGEARAVFREGGDHAALLGSDRGEEMEVVVEEARLQSGDIAVLCDPVVTEVIGPRDVTLILRRASDPAKASLFLSAIAERKGAEAPLTALIWAVPNYQGAAILTGETPPAKPPETDELKTAAIDEDEAPADIAKKQWLSKWRRRKE